MAQDKFREKLWTDNHWRIELSPKSWTMKGRYLVESAINRKLKQREKVFYKDKKSINCTLENIYVIDFERRIKFWILANQTMVVQSMKVWSRTADFCANCKGNDIPHHGLGLCNKCYNIDYWKPKHV